MIPRPIRSLVAVVTAVVVVLVAIALPPVATASVRAGEAIKACYDPVQNRWPNPQPDPGLWCPEVFSELLVTPLDGGVRVSWKALTSTVPWGCGPGGTVVACPITGVRVATYYVIPDVGVAGQGRCTATLGSTDGCVIGGLEPGRNHKVEVYVDLANGNWLRVNSSVTPCCAPPAAPVNVVITQAGDAMDVSWGQSPDWGGANELTYRVSTSPATSSCEVKVLACRLENLPRDVPITVSVTAANRAGASAAAVASPQTIPVTAPDPPSVVSARYPRPGTARITWTEPASDGGRPVTSYVVTSSPGAKRCTATQSRSCTITGLAGGRTYAFSVRAVNSVGTSGPSPAGVAGLLLNPASKPRDVRASASGGTAVVSWTKPASDGGGVLVEYVVRVGTATCTTKRTACTVGGLALGRTYPVTVVAVTTGGRSKPTTVSVTTVAPVAEPPSSPAVKPTATIT